MGKPSFEELQKLARKKAAAASYEVAAVQKDEADTEQKDQEVKTSFDEIQAQARRTSSLVKSTIDSIQAKAQRVGSDVQPANDQGAAAGPTGKSEKPSFEELQAQARQASSARSSSAGQLNYQKYRDNIGAALSTGSKPAFEDLQGLARENPSNRIKSLNDQVYTFSTKWDLAFSNDQWRSQEEIQKLKKEYDRERLELMSAVSSLSADYGSYDPKLAEYLKSLYGELSKDPSSQFGNLAEYWGRWDSSEAYTAEQQQRKEDAAYLSWDVAAEEANLDALKRQKEALLSQGRDLLAAGAPEDEIRKLLEQAAQIDRQIQEKEAGLSRAKAVQENHAYTSKYMEYMNMMADPAFKNKSHYKSTQTGKGSIGYIEGYVEGSVVPYYYDLGYADPMYDYINKNPEAVKRVNTNYSATGETIMGMDLQFLQEMTAEEVAVFNGLYNPADTSAAYEYIDFLTADLKARARAKDEAYWANFAKESPVGATVFSLATSPLKSLGYVGQVADYLDDGKLEKNARYNSYVWSNSAIRQQVAADIEKNWGKAGSFGYNAGMSMLDFLGSTAIAGGNKTLALSIMGTGAAADMTMQSLDRGLSSDQAFALGTVAGLAETLMENISFNALFKGDMSKGAIAYILNNAFDEGREEVGTSVINLLADIIIAKDKSLWRQSIDAYKAKGYSEAEAFGRAVGDQAASMGLDFLGGFLSGGVMSGGNYALSTLQQNADHKQVYGPNAQALVTEALQLNPYNSFALEMAAKLEAGKTLSGAELRKLVQLNENAASNGGDQTEVDTSSGENTIASKLAAEAQQGQVGAAVAQQVQPQVQPQVQQIPVEAAPMSAREAFQAEINRQLAGGNVSNLDTEALAEGVRARAAEALDSGEIDQEDYRMAMDELEQMDLEAEGRAYARANQEAQVETVWRKLGRKLGLVNENGGNANGTANYEWQSEAARSYLYDGGGQRDAGTGAGGQAASMAEGPGIPQPGADAGAEAAGSADSSQSIRVSGQSLGVSRSTGEASIRMIPPQAWTDEQVTLAQEIQEKTGKQAVFILDTIPVRNPDGGLRQARGAFTGEQVIVQVNNREADTEQIAAHEIYHAQNAYLDGKLNEEVKAKIIERFSKEEFEAVVAEYVKALEGVYDVGSGVSETMNRAALELIEEEVLADAYAGINAFGANAGRFFTAAWEKTNELGLGYPGKEMSRELSSRPPVQTAPNDVTSNDPGRYSIKNTSKMDLPEQLKRYYNRTLKSSDSLYFGTTPTSIAGSGLRELPLAFTTLDFQKSTVSKHNVPRRAIKALRENLGKALFSFRSGNRIGFVLPDIDADGKPLILGIEAEATMDRMPVNAIRSIYGLDNPREWIKNQINAGKSFVMYNEKEANAFLQTYGYWASVEDGIKPLSDKIAQKESAVKESFSFDDSYQGADSDGNQLTAEQQAYFADSQARDRFGRLLVLYHQTADVFTVFNPRHEGAGTSDQGTPFGIFMKRSANDIGLKGKYQMALYANITNPLRATSREDLNHQFRMLSSEYAEICDRIEQVNAEYSAEAERLHKAFVEYIVSWRKANPDASRQAIYDDPGFIEIYEAEDRNIEAWPEALKDLEIAAKNAITVALRDAGYDGVFLENDVGSWGRKTDAIIALDPEQVKNITNKTPTSNPDIRYSVDAGGYEPSVEEDEARVAYFENVGAQRQQQYVEGIREAESDARLEYFEQQAELQPGEDTDPEQVAREVEEMRRRSEPKPEPAEAEPVTPIAREDLPAKARDYLARQEGKTLQGLRRSFGVTQTNAREFLKETVQQISDEYLATGKISQETADRLFEDAWKKGEIEDREFYDQYKHIKEKLRTTAVTLDKRDQEDIADFRDFKSRSRYMLKITNEGGMPVDSLYEELRGMAPELFPESITHPADQLVAMYEVGKSIVKRKASLDEYYGPAAASMKQYARESFDEAMSGFERKLWAVRRFVDDKTTQAEQKAQKPKVRTLEEALEAGNKMKDARRASERAVAKSLLTASDEEIVGKLLRGEMSLAQLDPSRDNVEGIRAVYEAKRAYEEAVKPIAEYKRLVHAQLRSKADGFLDTANSWKDKKSGKAYMRETMTRNVYDIVPDKALAKRILQAYFEPVQMAEAARTRFKTEMRDRVRAMKLSRKIDKGNIVSEAAAVQILGEAQDNMESLKRTQAYIKTRDGKTLDEWGAVIENLWLNNPKLDKGKIQRGVEEFRKIYDELFTKMNEVRVRFGYEPVSYRKGYFPHFQPDGGDGIMAFFGKAFGINTQVDVLPTTINGLTHTFRPGTTWFGNAQERLGFNTVYDAVEGFDRYIEGVSDVIYHTENIQNLRALARQMRYRSSDEGMRKQADEIMADSKLSDHDKELRLKELYENGKYALSNFVNELEEYTNLLANKKSRLDRTAEAFFGRNFTYRCGRWLNSRVAANMVAGNVSSAMTNFIPLTQAAGRVGDLNMLKAMMVTMVSPLHNDGIANRSDFLTSRRGSDALVKYTPKYGEGLYGLWRKIANPIGAGIKYGSEFAGWLMETFDKFTSGSIVRAAYYKNLESGMSEAEALHEADVFAAGVMAGRAKGDMPTLFHSVNPLMKAFTAFQLEVNNQFSEVYKDIPRHYRERAAFSIALHILSYFIRAHLFNDLFEALFGYRPALDPIDILNDLSGDLSGYELPSFVDLLDGDANFKVEKKNESDAVLNLFQNTLSQLPFSSGLNLVLPDEWEVELDGGRIPVASAIPNLTTLLRIPFDRGWSPEYKWKKAKDELNKLAYVIPPFGGGQISKTWKGIKAFTQGGSYGMDSAGNDLLQYPIYKDSPIEALGNALRVAVMGKSSVPEAVEWVEDGFDSFGSKQTAMYKDMLDAGVKARDAYEFIDELRHAQAIGVVDMPGYKSKPEVQMELIRNSKISDEAKVIAAYSVVSDSMREIMDMLDDEGVDAGTVLDVVYGYWDADKLSKGKQTAKKKVILDAELTENEKLLLVGELIGTDMESEVGNPTEYAKLLDAMDKGLGVDEYLELVLGGGDIDNYHKYADAGLTNDQALKIAMDLAELEPEKGKESVSDLQKWRTCVDMSSNEGVQLAALRGAMDDSDYTKVAIAYDFGVSPDAYITFREIRSKFDADGNGSYTSKETRAAIDSMAGLTKEQRAALWQIVSTTTSAKNNPYSREVGQAVLDAKERAKG